jgi:glycosyltransferase involved in cell wall biosynthesis
MNVLIATYTFLPDIGGVATSESVLAAQLVHEGHDVTVVTLTRSTSSEALPYRVLRRPLPLSLCRLYLRADIVILSNLALRLAFPLLFIPRRFALRHHSDSAWRLSKSASPLNYLKRFLMRRAVHFMTSAYCGNTSGLVHKVTYPFPFVSGSRYETSKDRRLRAGLLFVGRLTHEKGLDFLLARLSMTRSILGHQRLTVVGSGPLLADLQKRIEIGELHDVSALGPLSLEQTATEMRKAKYVIVPSLWQEPFGAVALEAISCGAITLHSTRGGLCEATGALGFGFDPDDDEQFEKALIDAGRKDDELLHNPNALSAYHNDIETWCEQFAPHHVTQTILTAMQAAGQDDVKGLKS